MNEVNKKLKTMEVYKDLAIKTFVECNATTEEGKWKSIYETLKRNINAVKTIEDKIINVSKDEKLTGDIIIEGNEFERKSKDLDEGW